MHTIRPATEHDAATIARQRVKMFQDNGFVPTLAWDELEQEFHNWTVSKLRQGTYIGWIAEEGEIIGGAGLWLMEFPPHWMHIEARRGYLLNFYVAPEARSRGLGREFVRLAVAECEARGVQVATLHASAMGRPIYESMGWKASTEMMLRPKR